jgi:hypothetical protein
MANPGRPLFLSFDTDEIQGGIPFSEFSLVGNRLIQEARRNSLQNYNKFINKAEEFRVRYNVYSIAGLLSGDGEVDEADLEHLPVAPHWNVGAGTGCQHPETYLERPNEEPANVPSFHGIPVARPEFAEQVLTDLRAHIDEFEREYKLSKRRASVENMLEAGLSDVDDEETPDVREVIARAQNATDLTLEALVAAAHVGIAGGRFSAGELLARLAHVDLPDGHA